MMIVPTISMPSQVELSDGRKYNVGNISRLSMAIAPSHVIVYYHKLLKMLKSYSVYPNVIIRWRNNVYQRKSAKGITGDPSGKKWSLVNC